MGGPGGGLQRDEGERFVLYPEERRRMRSGGVDGVGDQEESRRIWIRGLGSKASAGMGR